MPNIQLNVEKLRAYTRAPFYSDTVREAPKDDIQYVRSNGEWVPLDVALLEESLQEFTKTVEELQKQLDAVDIKFIPSKNQLVFVDGLGNETVVPLPSTNVDGTTIGLTDTNALYVMDTADNKTIKITDVQTVPHELDSDVQKKVSGKLRVEAIYAEEDTYLSGKDILDRLVHAETAITDLENYTQGNGGFLPPQEFYNNEYNPLQLFLSYISEAERNTLLSRYARIQLQSADIPTQTKVKDMAEGNVWVWNGTTWLNDGPDAIVTANNQGVLGVVTGVAYDPSDENTKFKISVINKENGMSSGKMQVNGLAEEFREVVYKSAATVQPLADSYVQRTIHGTVRVADSVGTEDAINQGEFNDWQLNSALSKEDIFNIVDLNYLRHIHIDTGAN